MTYSFHFKLDVPQRTIFILQTYLSKGAQKNMLKSWNFTKNKVCHRCFHNNLQKLFRKKIYKNSNGHILLIVVLMVSVRLKLQMEIADENDPLFTRLPFFHISILILRTAMYPSAKTHPGPSSN